MTQIEIITDAEQPERDPEVQADDPVQDDAETEGNEGDQEASQLMELLMALQGGDATSETEEGTGEDESDEDTRQLLDLFRAVALQGVASTANSSATEEAAGSDPSVQAVLQGLEIMGITNHDVSAANPTTKMVRFQGTGNIASFRCGLVIRSNIKVFSAHVRSQLLVPAGKRSLACEYLTRANYGLTLGNFELDMADGEVGFKVSNSFMDHELTPQSVTVLVGTGLATMEKFLPGLWAVCYADKLPEVACRECENRAD